MGLASEAGQKLIKISKEERTPPPRGGCSGGIYGGWSLWRYLGDGEWFIRVYRNACERSGGAITCGGSSDERGNLMAK